MIMHPIRGRSSSIDKCSVSSYRSIRLVTGGSTNLEKLPWIVANSVDLDPYLVNKELKYTTRLNTQYDLMPKYYLDFIFYLKIIDAMGYS